MWSEAEEATPGVNTAAEETSAEERTDDRAAFGAGFLNSRRAR